MEYFAVIFVHVAFAILWAGGAITAGFFLVPAVLEAGPSGGAVMAGITKRRFPIVMSGSAILVVLSGIRLYMARANAAWLATPEGIGLSIGALLGIGAFFIGMFVQKPLVERLGALSGQVAASGGPPTPEQAKDLQALRERLGKIARVTAWHIIGATVLMTSHRLLSLF